MSRISCGRLLARALKKQGVEVVFTISGAQVMSMLHGCKDEGIEIIDVRHEGAGAHAADAYAKASGKMAAVMAMSGPGITNTVTSMLEAITTGSPLLMIGGCTAVFDNETGEMQDCNTLATMATVTKWAKKCYQGKRVGEYVTMAVREAWAGTPGPVYLEVPMDVSHSYVEESEIVIPEFTRHIKQPCGNMDLIKEAAKLLVNAKQPVISIGDSARYQTEGKEFVKELVKYLDIPTNVQLVARGAFANEKEEPLFTIGLGAMAHADVILELSTENNYIMGKGKSPFINKDARVIQVHTDSRLIGYNTPAHLGIVGGVCEVCEQILSVVKEMTPPKTNPEWIAKATKLLNDVAGGYVEGFNNEDYPIHPGRLAKEIFKFMDNHKEDWSVATDGGDCRQWVNNNMKINRPGKLISVGPLGPMGMGTPFTLGSYVANKKPVIYYTGDGSFGFYPMELDTCERVGANVITIIANDSAWGMVKMYDKAINKNNVERHGFVASELPFMRSYEKFAETWGGLGFVVEKIEDLIPAMNKIYESGKPGIINVKISQTAMSPRTKMFATMQPYE